MPFTFLKQKFLSPLLEFIHDSRAMGIVIILSTFISLLLANLPFGESYTSFWNAEKHLGNLLPHSLVHWINDGLMALFFFMVGMEIKRELLIGELASIKKSILPVAGALGGMLVPALLFTLFNLNTEFRNGWGIPMATDIAFSLGVASLLGSRAPVALKIFLTALAIIDDLGAIVAIAVFYSDTIRLVYLGGGFLLTAVLVLLNFLKIKISIFNYLVGIAIWFCIYNSGIHATIAGVLFAFTIPVNRLSAIEHSMHNFVNFIVVPVFVLANTAISIPAGFVQHLTTPLSLGIITGLLVGKPAGILLFCFITVKLKLGELANGINWKHMMGLGLLAAIGFTMSIFIAMLAFKDSFTQNISKMAVMIASFAAILFSFLWFKIFIKEKSKNQAA